MTGLPAGDYDIYVVLFAQPGGGSGAFDGARALVHRADRGQQPDGDTGIQSVTTAVPATVTIGWSGLAAGTRYLGVVDYGDGSNTIGSTIVAVTP